MTQTPFQIALLAEVSTAGYYRYIPAALAAKYSLSKYQVNKQLKELVDAGHITKENKLTHTDGKYRTTVFLNVKS
ncbi:MAG: hypothetical protein K0S53_381 [Bacteroidetes bacterium]|jgi:DNA-binding MarR family transcriptional regulator|nr:hypothetical protein [Bacteroidota bacterium]